MNHVDKINKLENCIKDAQEELNLLKADIAKGEEVDLTLPSSKGWIIRTDGIIDGSPRCEWGRHIWVFKTEQEANWTQRHELAWRKLRFYADKLNPNGWGSPVPGERYYFLDPATGRDYSQASNTVFAELVPFHSQESAERALKELGDDFNYLWSWNRKPEERAR